MSNARAKSADADADASGMSEMPRLESQLQMQL